MKQISIIAAIFVGMLLLGVGINLKRANDLRNYAIANNCTWQHQGTYYGDNRDYICK